jgi:NAD(P)-dependent dehydrogenase (short-subunit alcohol dehydrogenase family)
MSTLSALHGASTVVLSKLFVTLPLPTTTPNLPNQTFIVTGANSGLGLETCRHLLRLGAGKLIMAVRSPEKGHAARRELLSSTGRKDESCVEVWPLDMDSYASVKSFAHRTTEELPRLDGVLANAGIMTSKFRRSDGGHEATLNVNVISTFLLGLLLLPKLRETARETGQPGRLTIPNSALHYMAPVGELEAVEKMGAGASIISHLDREPTTPGGELSMGRYSLSKLLVLWAVRELAARSSKTQDGGLAIVNTPNPSYCISNLEREIQAGALRRLARTSEEGSRALYHGLVLAGKESDGAYLTNCHVQW